MKKRKKSRFCGPAWTVTNKADRKKNDVYLSDPKYPAHALNANDWSLITIQDRCSSYKNYGPNLGVQLFLKQLAEKERLQWRRLRPNKSGQSKRPYECQPSPSFSEMLETLGVEGVEKWVHTCLIFAAQVWSDCFIFDRAKRSTSLLTAVRLCTIISSGGAALEEALEGGGRVSFGWIHSKFSPYKLVC